MNCVTIKVESDFEKGLLSCVSKAFGFCHEGRKWGPLKI